jgi:hypothetical protein
MNFNVLLFIIGIHLIGIFLIWGFLKIIPKVWLLPIPSKKTILFALSISYLISIGLIIGLLLFTKKYPPPTKLPNEFYEGKLKYLDSGKTPRDVGSVILITDKNGKRKKVECYMATVEQLQKGSIPCGYDDLAYKTFNGQYGKVWYYNDYSEGNPQDGRFFTRHIAIQIQLENPNKFFPFNVQSEVINAYCDDEENNAFSFRNKLFGFGFIVFFVILFINIIGDRLKKQSNITL